MVVVVVVVGRGYLNKVLLPILAPIYIDDCR